MPPASRGLRPRELRILRAFAGAMARGLGPLPPAAGPKRPGQAQRRDAVEVAEPISRYFRALPARSVRQLRLALWALELLPFPWRFSHSSLEAREDFLARLEGSTFPF